VIRDRIGFVVVVTGRKTGRAGVRESILPETAVDQVKFV